MGVVRFQSATVAHEGHSSLWLLVRILDSHGEGQPILAESSEQQIQLFTRFGHRAEVASKLQELCLVLQHFHISTLGNLRVMFLLLQRFVLLVVGHAEDAQLSLIRVGALGEHHKLGHEGHVDGLLVQFGRILGGIVDLTTIDEPEASGNGGGEGDARVDKGERCGSSNILPLSLVRST